MFYNDEGLVKCDQCGVLADPVNGCVCLTDDNDRPQYPALIGKTNIAAHLGISSDRFEKVLTRPGSYFHTFKIDGRGGYFTLPNSADYGWEKFLDKNPDEKIYGPSGLLLKSVTNVSSGSGA